MSKIIGLLLISMILICFYQEFVAADCCTVGYDKSLIARCHDGGGGTPCCGVGTCNLVCCNCDGGCRRG